MLQPFQCLAIASMLRYVYTILEKEAKQEGTEIADCIEHSFPDY
jgi:hypothetical protein